MPKFFCFFLQFLNSTKLLIYDINVAYSFFHLSSFNQLFVAEMSIKFHNMWKLEFMLKETNYKYDISSRLV
jgi:hypothetical protein